MYRKPSCFVCFAHANMKKLPSKGYFSKIKEIYPNDIKLQIHFMNLAVDFIPASFISGSRLKIIWFTNENLCCLILLIKE